MSKELNYYFNDAAFNKLVYDAGYDGIKDFAERSGIPISYKTIKRACNNGHCTKRTFYAISGALSISLESLKTAFEIEQFNEEKHNKNHYGKECNDDMSCLIKEFPVNYEEVIVCLTNDHCVSVKGKSIYWSWFDSDKTICFYDEGAYNGEDLKIAEFNKACVIGIIRKSKE